jgi:hypothetical protein
MPERAARSAEKWAEGVPPELLRTIKSGDYLPRLTPADVACICGKRGSRKSTVVKASLARWLEGKGPPRVVAFDPHDEYSQLGREVPGEVILGPLRNRVTVAELLEAPELLDAEDLSLAVVCEEPMDAEAVAADFEAVSALVLEHGDCVFVVEEAALLQEHCGGKLKTIATQSRHAQVPVVIVSQWLFSFHYSMRKQFSHARLYRQTDPDEIKKSAEVLRSQDAAERLATLAPGECVAWSDAG